MSSRSPRRGRPHGSTTVEQPTKRLTTRIPVRQRRWLGEEAERRGVSLSALLVSIIDAAAAPEPGPDTTTEGG